MKTTSSRKTQTPILSNLMSFIYSNSNSGGNKIDFYEFIKKSI